MASSRKLYVLKDIQVHDADVFRALYQACDPERTGIIVLAGDTLVFPENSLNEALLSHQIFPDQAGERHLYALAFLEMTETELMLLQLHGIKYEEVTKYFRKVIMKHYHMQPLKKFLTIPMIQGRWYGDRKIKGLQDVKQET